MVFGVDSWAELKHPDMTASVTNPFLHDLPAHAAAADLQHASATSRSWRWSARKLAELTGDKRFNDYWKFVREGRTDVYLQRILDHSTNTKGYDFADLRGEGQEGHPGADDEPHQPQGGRLRAGRPTRGPGTRRAGGWSSTARRTSSSRPARTCRSTASRSTRRSTSRT